MNDHDYDLMVAAHEWISNSPVKHPQQIGERNALALSLSRRLTGYTVEDFIEPPPHLAAYIAAHRRAAWQQGYDQARADALREGNR